MSTKKIASVAAGVAIVALGLALYAVRNARSSSAALAVVTQERDALRSQLATPSKPTATPLSPEQARPVPSRVVATNVSHPRPNAAPLLASRSDPVRLERYHERFDGFVRQRGLTSVQADQLFEILSDWDDARQEFQSSLRQQGLSATPEAQAQRNRLQQQIEVEPLVALLGQEGEHAYFEYEGTTFYRAMLEPFAQALANQNLSLTDDQSTKLAMLIKPNMQAVKRDPTAMGSEAVINWAAVLEQATAFLTPAQLTLLQAQAMRPIGRR